MYKRQQRLAGDITQQLRNGCEKYNLNETDVLRSVVKRLKLQETIQFERDFKPRLSDEVRQTVWAFWYSNSEHSTLTTRLTKLRVTDKPRCQQGLEYPTTVTVVVIRKRKFYQSIWKVTSSQLLGLYQKYIEQYPQHVVSKGTFFSLKPFNVRNASKQDIEMCLCKLHLHMQWAFNSLLEWAKKQDVDLEVTNFRNFLKKLMAGCPAGEHTHIAWECAGNKKALCGHINEEWSDMKKTLIKFDDEKAPTVLFKEFQKQLVYDKTGKVLLNKKGNEVIFSVIVTMCQQITRKIYTI